MIERVIEIHILSTDCKVYFSSQTKISKLVISWQEITCWKMSKYERTNAD